MESLSSYVSTLASQLNTELFAALISGVQMMSGKAG